MDKHEGHPAADGWHDTGVAVGRQVRSASALWLPLNRMDLGPHSGPSSSRFSTISLANSSRS
ncbi:MAG: hypothetical protein F4W68_07780 [Cenarchaeum sp. SB0661_bin_35]|nr:hypothetical protein [Cenarchaeum sp. SB0667_bin_13]MYC80376.1 hypothetical protein [Cenarchaeum sp. SB0661_bin_35]MYI51853.1 hypothetical protein [Cenarchaeum sp. SB0673_bin_9]